MISEAIWPGGPQVYLSSGAFSIGTDALLLARFALGRGVRAADLGCGSGVIGLALAWHNPAVTVECIDIQPAAIHAAEDNILLNGLEGRVKARLCDLREMGLVSSSGSFDLIVSNPPYFPVGAGRRAHCEAEEIARTEKCCTLHDLCAAASRLLKNGGRLCVVHRAARLCELMVAMSGSHIEPKRLITVHPSPSSPPSLVLIEGVRGAKPGLVIQAPLFTQSEFGNQSQIDGGINVR